jgi:hypothetical protein
MPPPAAAARRTRAAHAVRRAASACARPLPGHFVLATQARARGRKDAIHEPRARKLENTEPAEQ